MLKKTITCLFILGCLAATACKKDDEIRSVVKDIDTFTTELVKKVDSAQGPEAGLEEAQKFFDAKKGEIKAKLASIKDVRNFQVSEETMKFMTDSITKNMTSVASLELKYVSQSVEDPAFKAKLEKLVSDYRDLLTS